MTGTAVGGATGATVAGGSVMRREGEVSRIVEGEATALWHRVADVTRTPEWSLEVTAVAWASPAGGPRPGARFRGANRFRLLRWTRECEVLVAEPGREFRWRTVPEGRYRDSTVWFFRFEPAGEGRTRVSHGYEIVVPLASAAERLAVALLPHHRDRSPDLARSLERLAARAPQARLGQAHTAHGPLDLNAMWVMHHAFRRDLRDLALAVPATPVDDAATWAALRRRWTRFADALHHHHRVEDLHIWPPLLRQVSAAGDAAGVAALAAMEAEHALIDPALASVASGFGAMAATPSADARERLAADVVRARELLADHLAHEETAALPLAQRYLPVAAWAASEAAARREFGLRDLAFTVPWTTLKLPPAEFGIAFAHGGRTVRALLRLTRRRFLRGHAAAFRHLPARPAAG